MQWLASGEPGGALVAGEVEVNPTVARRVLATRLRTLRIQHRRSLSELMTRLGASQGQVSRLDAGERGFRVEDVRRLCDWYGVPDPERAQLVALAEDARRRAWWQKVDLADSYRRLIGVEQAAVSISEFCNTVVPGLLQTERYARAATALGVDDSDQIDAAVAVRLRRQQVLERTPAPHLSVIIDEAVLARIAGSADVMREQLDHLLAAARRPRVTVRVIAFEAGLYAAGGAEFILLGVDSRLPDFYYAEDELKCWDTSERSAVERAALLWRQLQAKALDPDRSIERIVAHRDRTAGRAGRST
jgi:transcriptional regulator with XRE-family HTH domain